VNDRQGAPQPNGTSLKEGGLEFNLTARTQIRGFHGVLDYTYLSSYLFREAFFYSPSSTIWSQNNSIGYLQRHFNDDVYALNIVLQRTQNFNSITYQNQVPNQIIIQKLPSIEFSGRDQEIASGSLPVWFSFGSTAGMLNREEPTVETTGSPTPEQIFKTGQVGRLDVRPRVTTELNFKGFSLNPSMTLGATDYTNSYAINTTTYAPGGSCGDPTCPVTTVVLRNGNLFRKDADFALDLRFPALEKIYKPPKWLHLGEKAKHVLEAQATYEYVTGINQFQRTILFDASDILSNTNQITYSLTNRLYTKDKSGNVKEVVTWRLVQAYYFDPTFGNTVITGQRNVVLATEELTPYTFLDMPRSYSPVISSLTVNPYTFLGLEYRAEYDPLTHKFLDHSLAASVRQSKFFGSVSETAVTTNPILIPQQNQLSFGGGYGASTRKGWNAAGSVVYDMLHHQRLFDFFQVSYNTDCCGFSFELRNFNLGIRQENQYFFSFSVANIGTFGSLQKQARIF
jgi:LPS-assembly protein